MQKQVDHISPDRGEILFADLQGAKGIDFFFLDDDENVVRLKNIMKISFDENGRVNFELSNGGKRIDGYFSIMITADTISLIQNEAEREAAKEYLESNDLDSCLLLRHSFTGRSKIAPVPKKIELLEKNENVKLDEKDDLKAYETPEDFLRIFVTNIADLALARFKKDAAKAYLSEIVKRDDIAERHEKKTLGEVRKKIFQDFVFAVTKDDPKSFAPSVYLKNENAVEDLKFIANASSFTELRDFLDKAKLKASVPYINFFDPQAGSGKGILSALDETGLDGALVGTEYRDIKSDDERYKVVTGVNFALYEDALADALHSKQLEKNVKNTVFWLNPPYTTDDYIARNSVEILPKDVFMGGLFPVKMLNFLKKRFRGKIYIVPNDIVGYADKNVPQRFLFVIGRRNGLTEENEFEYRKKYGGLTDMCEVVEIPPSMTKERFEESVLADMKNSYYDLLIDSMAAYFGEAEARKDMLFKALEKAIENKRRMLSKQKEIAGALDGMREKLLASMLPTEVVKHNAILPDLRFFSESGKYKKYNFYQVVSNVSLLDFYAKNAKGIYDIVKQVADELGIRLPVEASEPYVFDIADPKKPKTKDLVTNADLGMMRLYYYPSVFDLSKDEQKERFSEILSNLLSEKAREGRGGFDFEEERTSEEEADFFEVEKSQEILRELIRKADKAIVKTAKAYIRLDNAIASEDVLVLTDKYGIDIAKINIPLSDIYAALEKEGLFNIEDFIELAEMPPEKKDKIVDNFGEYFDAVLMDIYMHANGGAKEGFDEFKNKILADGKAWLSDLQNKRLTPKEFSKKVLGWAKSEGLKDYFESKFIIPDTASAIAKNVKKNLGFLPSGIRKDLTSYIVAITSSNIVSFYEDKKEIFVATLKEQMNDYITSEKEEKAFENFVIQFNDDIAKEYSIKKAILRSYAKLADFFFREYVAFHSFKDAGKPKHFIFDKVIAPMLVRRFKLKPHQAEEALRYVAIEDQRRLEMLFWEMRSGKTRAMIAIGFLLGLLKKKDISLVLETANMPDITEQMFDSFPFLMSDANFFIGDENKIEFLQKDNILKNFPTTEIYPNLVKILQPYLVGKGDTANKLKEDFVSEFEKHLSVLETAAPELDKIEQAYQNSEFCDLLKLCSKG